MASEPYWRPVQPSPARAINERHLLAGAAPIKESFGHLTITTEGEADWGVPPSVGRTVVYKPIELDVDNPDVMVVIDWTVGLTDDQVRSLRQMPGTQQQLDVVADGFRQMNLSVAVPESHIRRPHYTHPTDAANPDAAGLPVETVHETTATAETTSRRWPIPPDAPRDLAPVAFTEVVDLTHTRPVDVPKRVRGPKGSRGPLRKFRGRPLD